MPTRKYLDRLEHLASLCRVKDAKATDPWLRFRPHNTTLEHLAKPIGGRQALIELARLSKDARARKVIRVHDSLSQHLSQHRRERTGLSEICWACQVAEENFLGAVMEELWELDVDAMPLIERCVGMLAREPGQQA